jgi:ribosomal protein S20
VAKDQSQGAQLLEDQRSRVRNRRCHSETSTDWRKVSGNIEARDEARTILSV